MSALWTHAAIGAYSAEGRAWVDELREVLDENVRVACAYVAGFEGVRVSRPEGTFMLWLDCTEWCSRHGKDVGELLVAGWRVGVAWQDGRPFHGPCHIRMNLALPTARVREAFERLATHVFA